MQACIVFRGLGPLSAAPFSKWFFLVEPLILNMRACVCCKYVHVCLHMHGDAYAFFCSKVFLLKVINSSTVEMMLTRSVHLRLSC